MPTRPRTRSDRSKVAAPAQYGSEPIKIRFPTGIASRVGFATLVRNQLARAIEQQAMGPRSLAAFTGARNDEVPFQNLRAAMSIWLWWDQEKLQQECNLLALVRLVH